MKIGFDNEKYLKMQSEHIMERISKFDNKLYLEFGGKLFDDFHAARVLPGFAADSKLQLLLQLSDQAEIVMVVNVEDIIKNKIREYFLYFKLFRIGEQDGEGGEQTERDHNAVKIHDSLPVAEFYQWIWPHNLYLLNLTVLLYYKTLNM